MEQCSAAGQPEQVERCVLRMDVASLDFSQVRGWLILKNSDDCAQSATAIKLNLRPQRQRQRRAQLTDLAPPDICRS